MSIQTPQTPSRPYLQLFGGCTLFVDTKEIHLGPSKNYALLVFLALDERSTLTRAYLADLLWPRAPQRRGLHSLSQALYSLGQRLEDPPWATTTTRISVKRGKLDIDVVQLTEKLDVKDYGGAARLYQGPFLDGFNTRDAVKFQQWRDARAAEFALQGSIALKGYLTTLETAGQWRDIDRVTAHLLTIDPYDMAAHSARIRSLVSLGHGERAGYELDRLVRLWRADLGMLPQEEIAKLRALIRAPLETRNRISVGQAESERPFVGRVEELRVLRRVWSAVTNGNGRSILTLGPPGVGKSRLYSQFIRFVSTADSRVLVGRCHAAEARTPYSGLANLLNDGVQPRELGALEPVWGRTLCYVFPELGEHTGPKPEASLDHGFRRRIFEALSRFFRVLAKSRPLVLFIDDVHWADESTLAALHYAARRLTGDPVLFLLAGRPGYAVGDWHLRGATLATDGLNEPWQALPLAELTTDHALALVASALGYKHSGDLSEAAAMILAYAGGNPYCLLHLAAAYESGTFQPPIEHSDTGRQPLTSAPPEVERFLTAQFETLSKSALRVLSSLAVLQRPTRLEDVASTSGFSTLDTADALTELTKRNWILTTKREIEFSHALIRDVAYRHVEQSTRRALHLSAGKILSDRIGCKPSILSRHFDLAGDAFLARIWATKAAKQSIAVTAFDDAEYFLRVAASNTEGPIRSIVAEKRLAEFLTRQRKWQEAHALWTNLEKWATEHDARRLATIASAQIITQEVRCGALDSAVALNRLDRLLRECASDDHASRETVLFIMADAAETLGNSEKILYVARRMLAQAKATPRRRWADRLRVEGLAFNLLFGEFEPAYSELSTLLEQVIATEGSKRDQWWIRTKYAYALLLSGKAVAAIEEIIAVDKDMEQMGQSAPAIQNNLGVAYMEIGLYARASAAFNSAQATLDLEPDAHTEVYVLSNLCELNFVQGHFRDATEYAKRIITLGTRTGSRWSVCQAWAFLGLIALLEGRFAEARENYVKLRTGYVDDVVGHPHVVIFLARMGIQGGDIAEGRRRLKAATEDRTVYGGNTYGLLRLEFEYARTFLEDNPQRAAALAIDLRRRAAECSARPLVEDVDALLERLAARGARGAFGPAAAAPTCRK